MTNRTRYYSTRSDSNYDLAGRLNTIAQTIEECGGRVASTRILFDAVGMMYAFVTGSFPPQKQTPQTLGGDSIHLSGDVGVDVPCERDRGVSEAFLDDGEGEAGFEASSGVPVSEVMYTDAGKRATELTHVTVPAPIDGGGGKYFPGWTEADELAWGIAYDTSGPGIEMYLTRSEYVSYKKALALFRYS